MKIPILVIFLLLFANLCVFASSDQTVTITTTGQGETIEQATDNSLRSAIEQTFGAFISTRTEILNDELVSDQIASVASGNIQSYDVLAQAQISESLWGVTVRAVVSVTKLTSFVQARGVQVEIQGGLFAANIRQQLLNEEAEVEAVRNMVLVLHELFQTSFDYSIEAGNPVASDATSQNWTVPLTITVTANDNMAKASEYFHSTTRAISLTPKEVDEYKGLNKEVYSIERSDRNINYMLRRIDSLRFISYLTANLYENYLRLFEINSGLDSRYGNFGYEDRWSGYAMSMSKKFKFSNRLFQRIIRYQRTGVLEVEFPRSGDNIATFTYNDQRTLDEINQLTGYTVKPKGGWSRVSQSDVTNQRTSRTWMDRNLGALWPALAVDDPGSYGDYYNFEEAQSACPIGFRLPTAAEWDAERKSWSSNDRAGAFASPLKLPVAGGHNSSNGSLFGVGSGGYYWSSTADGSDAWYLYFNKSSAGMYSYYRSFGFSVRCLKN